MKSRILIVIAIASCFVVANAFSPRQDARNSRWSAHTRRVVRQFN